MYKSPLTYLLATAATTIIAQTTWVDQPIELADQLWSNSANWSSGLPGSSTAVTIGVQPAGDGIVLDTGGTIIGSFTVSNALTAPFTLTASGFVDSLQVNGAITNNDTANHIFDVPLIAGASATWTGPFTYSRPVTLGSSTVTVVGNHSFTNTLNFSIANSTYGRFVGAGTVNVSDVDINVTFSGYTPTAGHSFTVLGSNFTGASVSNLSLPDVSAQSLAWNTSLFASSGIISLQAIPEPSAFATLFGLGAVGYIGLRRRPRKIAA